MLYKFARGLFFVYFHLFFRLEVHGKENIPSEGACIICANHISMYDPLLIGIHVKRNLHFMAKKEFYKNWLLKRIFNGLNAFPVDRAGADMAAFRTAINLLKDGKILAIFAQGTRIKEGEAAAVKAGVALFATKSKAPVIPVGINTKYKLFGKVILKFGEPISFAEYDNKKVPSEKLNELANNVMDKVHELCV